MNIWDLRKLCVAILFATLCGCGGGSGGGSASSPVGSQPAPGVARGTISGFGSVFINGVEFDTSRATFSKDGDAAHQGDLSVGMVVKVRGDIDGHHVNQLEYTEDVKGPVDEVLSNGLRVMGQVVLVDVTTHVDSNLDLATVAPGNIVEVSGLRNANDEIAASFIEGKDLAAVRAFKVFGPVRNLDKTQHTFKIGGLTIDYTTAGFDDFTADDLANAQLVEVSDRAKAYNAGDLHLVATEVSLDSNVRMEDDDGIHDRHDDGERANVEGFVTQVVDATHIVVANTTVVLTSSTIFEQGDATNLVVGAAVEVHGTLASDGTVTATKIEFSHQSARVAGIVDSVDTAAGSMQVFGVTIDPAADARFEDHRDGVQPFDLGDIVAGDFVETRGVEHDSAVIAHRIQRDDSGPTRLRGAATHIDATAHTLTLLGVSVVTDANTQFRGGEDGEDSMSADAFFATLHDGQTGVDARWENGVTDPTVPVKELSTED